MLVEYKGNKIFAFADTHGMYRRMIVPDDADITINGVVNDFFKNCIDTVQEICSVSQPTDVHTRPETDVLHALHRLDALISIIPGRREVFIFHIVSWFWLRINTLPLPNHGILPLTPGLIVESPAKIVIFVQ